MHSRLGCGRRKPIDPDALFAALRRWTKPRGTDAASAAPKASETRETQELKIEGVSVADGVNRVAGNRRLYRNLLEQFCEKQAGAGQQIAAAIQTGDRERAERLAHTLKGVAGNLGIATVQQVAAKVEHAIRDGDGSVRGLAGCGKRPILNGICNPHYAESIAEAI